jgi:hypothetical protein
MAKYKRYYYKQNRFGELEDWCKVKNDGTHIGSTNCSQCKNCVKYSLKSVVCKVITKATGKE